MLCSCFAAAVTVLLQASDVVVGQAVVRVSANDTSPVNIHRLGRDCWIYLFIFVNLLAVIGSMLTWRHPAEPAAWVWCCAPAVWDGRLQQVKTTFCLMEAEHLLQESERSLERSNEMTELKKTSRVTTSFASGILNHQRHRRVYGVSGILGELLRSMRTRRNVVTDQDSPWLCLWSGREDPRLKRRNGLRLTIGGRLGFKGRAPSGGRGLRSGVTSADVFCRGCCRGLGDGVGAGVRAGDGGWLGPGAGPLPPGGFGCFSFKFCSISPACLTLLASADWRPALIPGLRGGRGKDAGLAGMDGIVGSPIGSLSGPGPGSGGERTVGGSLCWAGSLLGRIGLPNPSCEGRMLASGELALLLNMAFRALTSTFSS